MQSKWKQTLVFGAIALLLGTYFLFFEKDRPTDDQIKASKNDVQLFAGKTFDALEFGSAESLVRVEKKNGSWVITAPEEQVADGSLVESLVKQIVELKSSSSINPTPPITTINFGLNPVTKKFRIRETGTTEYTEVAIGKENPIGTGVYIAIGNSPTIYNVPSTVTTLADSTLESLRFKSPTPTATIPPATATIPPATATPPPVIPVNADQNSLATPENGS